MPDVDFVSVFARRVTAAPDCWEATAMFGLEGDGDMDELELAEYGETAAEAIGKAALKLDSMPVSAFKAKAQ
jgi:hypothetical protein